MRERRKFINANEPPDTYMTANKQQAVPTRSRLRVPEERQNNDSVQHYKTLYTSSLFNWLPSAETLYAHLACPLDSSAVLS